MDFESIKQLLKGNEMEEELNPGSIDVFNVFCKKEGEYISTIQVIENETDQGRGVTAYAHRLLEQSIQEHLESHSPEYRMSVFDEVAEVALKKY